MEIQTNQYLLNCRVYTSSMLYGSHAYHESNYIRKLLIDNDIDYTEITTEEIKLDKGREFYYIFILDEHGYHCFQLLR